MKNQFVSIKKTYFYKKKITRDKLQFRNFSGLRKYTCIHTSNRRCNFVSHYTCHLISSRMSMISVFFFVVPLIWLTWFFVGFGRLLALTHCAFWNLNRVRWFALVTQLIHKVLIFCSLEFFSLRKLTFFRKSTFFK